MLKWDLSPKRGVQISKMSSKANAVHDEHQNLQEIVKNEEWRRWTPTNSYNPNEIYAKRKEENLPELLNSGGAQLNSGQIRLMQRPLVRQWRRSTTAAELGLWGVERRKTIQRRRMRKDLVILIYKEGLISGHERRGGRMVVIQLIGRLNFREGIKIKIR